MLCRLDGVQESSIGSQLECKEVELVHKDCQAHKGTFKSEDPKK